MKKLITVLMMMALVLPAFGGFSLIRFGGRDQQGIVVNNDKKCYATSSLFDTGSQVANNHAPTKPLKDADGEWLHAAMVMENNTITDTTDIQSALDLVKQKNSETQKTGGDGQQEGGDKTKTGPSVNAALTGQGLANADQDQPNNQGEVVAVNKGELQELLETVAALKAENDALKASAPTEPETPAPGD